MNSKLPSRKNSALAILLSVVLGSCVTTGQDRERTRISGDSDCFFANTQYDWRALDDRNLIIWAPSRRCPYHVELFGGCHGLRFADTIGIFDRDGRICPYGGDAIIVDGLAPEQCMISAIRRLTEQELQQLYIEFGLDHPALEEGELREDCVKEKLP